MCFSGRGITYKRKKMNKLLVSATAFALFSSVLFAETKVNNDANQTNSAINFKGFASKTYNFLGIQTKEDNQKAFETIVADMNAVKIQQQEYIKQVSKTLEDYKAIIESIKKENILIKESNNSKQQDEKIAELKKEVVELKDEIKFLKNLLNETLKSSKTQQNQ